MKGRKKWLILVALVGATLAPVILPGPLGLVIQSALNALLPVE